MQLKKLELSGFKSFAKTTVLEFPSRITAIVGPNGSGKSNIAESIRWVLGEQSMKSLRGKKGEDLIWNGSPVSTGGRPQVARMGKASASLLFDNANGRIPIEFEEVILGRKIFRDGVNEYSLNNSPVRLKDVVELMARLGLGETKHNIIGQGEVDRLLLATSRERREMLEEALGLRVYHLKKEEAERKLEAGERNMRQAEALIREIAPHVKFLRSQAKRAETRERIAEDLRGCEGAWLAREEKEIVLGESEFSRRLEPLTKRHEALRQEIALLSKGISDAERQFRPQKESMEAARDSAMFIRRRQTLERELGRLEGRLEAEREKVGKAVPAADLHNAGEEIRAALVEIRILLEEDGDMRMVRPHLLALVEDIERALDAAERDRQAPRPVRDVVSDAVNPVRSKSPQATADSLANGASNGVKEIERAIHSLEEELERAGKEIAAADSARQKELEIARLGHEKLRELDSALRVKQDEERELALARERLKFDEERLRERKDAFRREEGSQNVKMTSPQLAAYEEVSQDDLRRKIERLRVRLEEVGGIDEAIVKEYEETEARHLFLTKEVEDLKAAHASLKTLIKELDQHVKKDFKEGFTKIKDEFHNYFRIIFGGGSARLRIVRIAARNATEEETTDKENEEEGIDIGVDLPRKRIHGLAMLSGGERALVAVALLFAITAVNPPPFLVLDETDAALDEANSQRYGAILKEIAKKTQLILVTHNRETMKCAGILYGVTMGDDGVSRLLSLKLEEAEGYTNR